MYTQRAAFVHSADDPATVLPSTGVGSNELIYVVLDNVLGAATVSIAPVGSAAATAFQAAAGEAWLYGPIVGEDIDKHGIFRAATGNTNIMYLSGRSVVDPRPGTTTVLADRLPGAFGPMPFVWQQLV